MSSSFLNSLDERTRELVSGILNETTISDKGKDFHLKTVLSSEEYQSYLKDVRKQDPSFLALIKDDNTAEVVRELLKETWLDPEKRNGLLRNVIRDEENYQEYLKEIEGFDQTNKEFFLKELDQVVQRMVEGMLERNELMKAEILVRSSGSSRAIDSFQRWKISKKLEEKRAETSQNAEVPLISSLPTKRQNIVILGERQVDTLYVVSAIINYLESTTPTGRKVQDTSDYCECDNWHSYILQCEHEGETKEICLISLYDDFLSVNKHSHLAVYLQEKTIHGTILALGMNLGDYSVPESLVHSYKELFNSSDLSECLAFFESSFALEQEKTNRRFWFVTNQLTNCRGMRVCETKANKNYLFMRRDWERDAEEMIRLFEEMKRVKPQVTKLIRNVGLGDSAPGPFSGEITITYERPFTVFKQ